MSSSSTWQLSSCKLAAHPVYEHPSQSSNPLPLLLHSIGTMNGDKTRRADHPAPTAAPLNNAGGHGRSPLTWHCGSFNIYLWKQCVSFSTIKFIFIFILFFSCSVLFYSMLSYSLIIII